MTLSSSTPRIRIMQAWYLLILALVAVSGGRWFDGWCGELIELLGLALMAIATLGRIWTSVHIAGQKEARLVTTGPYSLCRHPLYALTLVGGLGIGLATRSIAIAIATLAVLIALHFRAIGAEERTLLARHGQEFEDYRRRVPKLWPSRGAFKASDSVTVNLPVFWKAFLDAGTFVLIYILIQVLDTLRAAGLWPTLFELW